MRMGITINMGNYDSLRLDSSEWDNSYDCAMELINEILKLNSRKAEQYAMTYLSPFTAQRKPYKGEESEEIIKRNTTFLKRNGL